VPTFDEATDLVPDPQHTGVTLILRALWRETTLTQWPAFHDVDSARFGG
jgi:hypothetical protein